MSLPGPACVSGAQGMPHPLHPASDERETLVTIRQQPSALAYVHTLLSLLPVQPPNHGVVFITPALGKVARSHVTAMASHCCAQQHATRAQQQSKCVPITKTISVLFALLQDPTCGLKGAAWRSSVSATRGSSPGWQQRRPRLASSCRRCVSVQMRQQLLWGR